MPATSQRCIIRQTGLLFCWQLRLGQNAPALGMVGLNLADVLVTLVENCPVFAIRPKQVHF